MASSKLKNILAGQRRSSIVKFTDDGLVQEVPITVKEKLSQKFERGLASLDDKIIKGHEPTENGKVGE